MAPDSPTESREEEEEVEVAGEGDAFSTWQILRLFNLNTTRKYDENVLELMIIKSRSLAPLQLAAKVLKQKSKSSMKV